MLTCREIAELVTDYLEGRMGLGDRMRFRMHVAMCKPCRRYVEQMRQTIAALGQLPPDTDMPPELIDHFRAWRSPNAG